MHAPDETPLNPPLCVHSIGDQAIPMFLVITREAFAVYEMQPLNCVASGAIGWEPNPDNRQLLGSTLQLGSIVLRGSGDFPLSQQLEREIVHCWHTHYVGDEPVE